MSIDIRHLRHFRAVYREQSFNKAAQELGVTQSAITKSIQSLELQLRTKLFDRTTHLVDPTSAAEKLIAYANDTISALEAFEKQADQLAGLQTGDVSIGCGAFPLDPLLTNAVRAFSARYPNINISLQTGQSKSLLEKLTNRQLDVVVCDVSKFETKLADRHITIEPLPSEPVVLIHSSDQKFEHGPITQKNMFKYKWVAPAASPHFERQLRPHVAANSEMVATLEVDTISACLEIIKSSQILTAAPRSTAINACKNGDLIMADLPKNFQTNDGVHSLARKNQSPAIKTFIDGIKAQAMSISKSHG